MDRKSLREALVVGINSYPFLKKKKLGDLNLKAAIKDAEAIANMLEKYGKFRVQRLPKGYDEEGKERFEPRGTVRIDELKQAIINLFQPHIKNETPDVALLFFAGHGFVNTKGDIREGVLVTSEAQFLENISENDNISGISLSWLKEFLQDSLVKKQIVWLDCCFSGELLNFDGVANPNTQEKQVSRCFITASRSFQTATEKIDGKQGLFTDNLLECLNPENYGNGWVTNHILTESIQERMSQTSQAPMCYNSGSTIILTTNSLTEPLDERWKNVPPYRGLSYFGQQENDGVFFHGRTGLTDKLIEQVKNHNFVAVLGASGSGKSSLLRAGLLYQLKRGQEISGSDRWLCIDPFTPEEFPLKSLLKSLGKSLLEIKIKGEKVESLIQFIHQIEGKKVEFLTKELIEEKLIEFIDVVEAERVIMVMDQFEESFTLCKTHEERREFFDCFLAVLERRGEKFCVVLGIRADFLGRCSEYGGLANKIQGHQLLVTPLEEDEIEEVIKKPAALVAMDVEPKLVAQMREDFLRNPGSLPLLEYTLDALWKFATQGEEKSQYLTLETYTNLGGIEGTLTKRADAVFDSLSEEEKSVAQRIFLELVQPGEGEISSGKITDTRRRVILEKLPNERHSLELLSAVTDKLADKNNRLITKDKSEAGILLDIIHEDLIRSWKTLRKWVEEYQEALPVERKIEADAAEWEKDGKSENLLLRAGRLTKAEEYLRIYGEMALLDGLAYEFIEASRELSIREEEKEKERQRQVEEKRVKILGMLSDSMIRLKPSLFDTGVLLSVESMKQYFDIKKRYGKVDSDLLVELDQTLRNGVTQLPKHLHTLNHQRSVKAVAFSPDGKTIATASSDDTARLWDAENGKELATLYHRLRVNAVAFSPDGKTIATASLDKTARLWDTENGKELATLNHQNGVTAVAFSPDGKTIATASYYNKTARLWDTCTGKELATLKHQRYVNAVAFSPDGKTIATASDDKTARLWDTCTGKELATLYHQSMVTAVAFSPDGKTIATASWGIGRLWDTENGKELAILKHQEWVNAVAFSPDGKTIATTSDDKTARLWDTYTGKELATLYHKGNVNAVAFSPDGKTIATASDDKTARLWDTDTSKELATFYHQAQVKAVAFSPDGKTIATASWDNTARLWDTDTGNELATLNHQLDVEAVAFSPDGKTIATASDDKTARLWDTENGKELATLYHQDDVKAVAFSPDGKTIATASRDKTARLWDTENGKELATLNHQSWVNAVAFSPDGKTIATASSCTARLWDTENGKELAILKHQEWVNAVAFSPDGKTIATASHDHTARLWDTDTGNKLATLDHQSAVNAVAFSPDGKTIATASWGIGRLWDTENCNELATLYHKGIVNAVAFSPDGKTIATASRDGTARLHWATSEVLIQEACSRLSRNLTAKEWQQYINSNFFVTYQKTCKNLPVDPRIIALAPGKIIEGRKLAKDGKIEEAIYLFKKAQELSPEIDLEPNTENRETDPQIVANKLAASGKVEEGKKLAKQGKIEEAIALFKKAQELSPEIDLTPDTETKEIDPQILANKLAAPSKVEEGKKLAKQGKIEEAIALFKKAQELSPEIDLTPDTETKETDPQLVANKFVVSVVVEEGKNLAKQGKIEEAIYLFKKAQELSPEIDLTPDAEIRETDPQLVANKFAASSKVEEGKNLAKQGKIEEAIYLFKKAQELSPEIDLTPDTETKETDPQLVANKFVVSVVVEEGKNLAKQGKIEEAIYLFKKAQELSPEIDLTPDAEIRETDPQLVANKFAASSKVEEGKKLAKQGKIEEAIALFKKAQELSPEIDLAPDTETKETDPKLVANKLAALSKVEEGKKLAKQGKIEEAIALFKKAQELSPEIDLTPDAETRETDPQLVPNKFVVSVIVEEIKNLARQGKIEEAIYLFKKVQELSSEIDLDKEQQRQIEEQIVKLLGMLSDSIIRLKPSLFDTGVLLSIESMKQYFDIKKRHGKANSDLLVELDQTLRNGLTQLPKHLHTLNHQGRINAVAFSPDGKTVATASYDNTACLWDTDTGKELAILNHQDSVNAVAFSPDGKTMATRSNTTASLWETENGKELATLNHQGWVNAVAFSPDGKTIATASYDKTARLWDTDTGKELAILNHQEWVRAVAFSPDGKTIATASDDNTARLWDTNTGNELATLNHQGDVRAVVFSPDSKTIATASYDKTARLWDTDTGKELAILNHQGDVRAVVFSPDSKTIATASWDNTARLWDTDTGKELSILNHEYRLIAVAFSPDGKTIATASDDKTSRLWDTRNGKQLAILNHQDRVSAVAFSPDGKTIATASNDKTSRLWDTDPGKELATLNHQDIVKAVAFSPDGQTAATANDDTTACLHGETVEVLIQESCERLSRNLTAEEWQKYINSDLEKYQKTCENIPVHPSIIAEAKNLVKKGTKENLKKAIDISKKALELSPEIDITFVASDIVEEGKKLAKQGKIEEAIYLFKKAQELSPEIDLAPDTENRETDPQIVANKLAASSKVEEGQKLAKQGKIEEAIALFKKAQELSPEIDLAPNTETKETDPEIVANKLAAPGKVEEGQKLAKDGKIEEAIALFKKAQELSPEIDLAPDTETKETDPQIVANKLAAPGKVEEGQKLAKDGKIEEAIALFKKAQELSPEIDLTFVASDIVEEGKKLAKQGKIEEAIVLFKKAQELSPEIDLEPNTENRETDPQLVANKLAASGKVEEGQKLTKDGKIEEAIALFKKAQELSPEIDFNFVFLEIVEEGEKLAKQGKREEAIALLNNVQLVANKLAAPSRVEEGKDLARQGKIEEAIALFKNAQELSPEIDLTFVAADIVEEGKKLAKQGKIEEAIALFKNAQELSPEIDLDPNTETRETDPQIVANRFAASGKVEEGQKLAKQGKIEEAITLFKNAQELSPEIDLAPDTKTRETDPQLVAEIVAKKYVVSVIVEESKNLAKQGQIEEAIYLFKKAQELSPEIDLAPDTKTRETDPQLVAEIVAKKYVVSVIVEESIKLAKQGQIEEAIYLFKKAQKLSPEIPLDPDFVDAIKYRPKKPTVKHWIEILKNRN